jgi:hypothetical protein
MILVTRMAGYIGSHTCLQLLLQGQEVMVVDNLCNSSPVARPISTAFQPQQFLGYPGAAAGHAAGQCQNAGVFIVGHGVWRFAGLANCRRRAAQRHQPLWPRRGRGIENV